MSETAALIEEARDFARITQDHSNEYQYALYVERLCAALAEADLLRDAARLSLAAAEARVVKAERLADRLERELTDKRRALQAREARVAALTQENERLRAALADRAERPSDLGREIRSKALDERIAVAVEEQAEDTLAALDGLVGLHEEREESPS